MTEYKDSLYGKIPADWDIKPLASICVKSKGVQTGPFGSQLHKKDYVSVGIPIITVEHLIDNRIVADNAPMVSQNDYNRLEKYSLQKGDIVFSRVGSVDRRALVHEKQGGWLFSGRCLRLRPDDRIVNPAYLSWFFGLPSFKEHIIRTAVGSTMPSLNTDIMNRVQVVVPPLSIQKRIADILGSLDDKIELNRRMNETLEQMAMALYKHWFVDFGPFQDGEFVESELGMIPKGWEVKIIGDVTTNYDSKRVPLSSMERAKRQGTYPYYGAAGTVDYVDEYLFDGTFLLIGEDGSVAKPDGKPYLQYVEGQFWVNNHAHVVQGEGRVSTEWLKLFFETVDISRYVTGAVQPKLTKRNLNSLKLVVPPMDESMQFRQQISHLFEMIKANARETASLEQTREYLLPRLLSGEIDLEEAKEQVEEVV